MNKFIAYNSEAGETEDFGSFKEAEEWLQDDYARDSELSDGVCSRNDYIAKIVSKSKYVITDSKENYCEYGECPNSDCIQDDEACEKEVWPFDSEFDTVGKIEFNREDSTLKAENDKLRKAFRSLGSWFQKYESELSIEMLEELDKALKESK